MRFMKTRILVLHTKQCVVRSVSVLSEARSRKACQRGWVGVVAQCGMACGKAGLRVKGYRAVHHCKGESRQKMINALVGA